MSTRKFVAPRLQHLALHFLVVLVVDGCALARHHHPVAILEIADGVGERTERNGIRPEIHLAIAIADRQRRALARADQEVLLAGKDEAERECAAQLRQHSLHRVRRRLALVDLGGDEMGDDLGVGLARKRHAVLLESLAQLAEILDDAVMHHSDARGRMRMGVGLVGTAMRRPAGMADADMTLERRDFSLASRFLSLPSARRRSSAPSSSVATPAES